MSFARHIVIDTGVLVSAAIRPDSTPALALEKALRYFDVCVSDATLAELQAVLSRAKFDRYTTIRDRHAFLEGFIERSIRIEVSCTVSDCIDPEDNKFLALAEAAEAELIVASDPHLTSLHPWRGIPIVPPAAFLVAIR
ncbi:MAG: putative toxin-antitoxin system toxin component, PIN family [Rhodocyclaceae bacterium]